MVGSATVVPVSASGGDTVDEEVVDSATDEEDREAKRPVLIGKRNLKAEAQTTTHMMCHRPYNPWCDVCRAIRVRRRQHRRRITSRRAPLTHFGELLTADHIVIDGIGQESCVQHRYAVLRKRGIRKHESAKHVVEKDSVAMLLTGLLTNTVNDDMVSGQQLAKMR